MASVAHFKWSFARMVLMTTEDRARENCFALIKSISHRLGIRCNNIDCGSLGQQHLTVGKPVNY
jgi:hypothetical protein